MTKLTVIASVGALALAASLSAQNAVDYTVRASAVAQVSPPRLTFSIVADPFAQSYQVFRKAKDAAAWGTAVATLAGSATSWVDSSVSVGQAYEYRFSKQASTYTGEGYLFAGIQYSPADTHGTVLLLVDSNVVSALSAPLARLTIDLIAEGWKVTERTVGRSQPVTAVKAVIQAVRTADPTLEAVFIIGHVPVPYSGNLNPDGHPDHLGAWPADVYYGVPSGTWTDNSVNDTVAGRQANRNVPGDGKFDQTIIPGEVALEVGRADLYDMPAFGASDTALMLRYLDKDHEFRSGAKTYARRGFIDDNFGGFSGEAFAASGWRNFTAMFGEAGVAAGDFVHAAITETYLGAYGCGGGSYNSAGGIGATSDIAGATIQAVFTSLFGSYFGDWDNSNNFLRSPLASRPSALACFWAGRPHWQLHHMALGEDLGYATRLSQNNNGTYVGGYGMHYVHIALMGDPTLRLFIVRPPSGLRAARSSASRVDLSWTASPDTVVGYHVYRGSQTLGQYTRLTTTPVAALAYTDNAASGGVYTYVVRPSKLETSASGTFYNVGPGVLDSVTAAISAIVAAGGARGRVLALEPVGRDGVLRFACALAQAGPARIAVLDLAGRAVVERRVMLAAGSVPMSLDLAGAGGGVYVLTVEADGVGESARFVYRQSR